MAPRRRLALIGCLFRLTAAAAEPPSLPCAALAASPTSPAFCAAVFAGGLGRGGRQTLAVTVGGAVLHLGAGPRVLTLWDGDADGHSDGSERAVLLEAPAGGAVAAHGLAAGGGYLYVSSATGVRRWAYTDGSRGALAYGAGRSVVSCDTRGLALDAASESLYAVVAVAGGSSIRRFDLSALPPSGAFDCTGGAVVAAGLRGEQVGIGLDVVGQLWGVDDGNGTSVLAPPVLGVAGAARSGVAFFGAQPSRCQNTSWWTLPGGTAAEPRKDYNLNGCPDAWEGDGVCDDGHAGSGCPVGSDAADCGGATANGCEGGGFPCDMVGNAFVAVSGGTEGGHRISRVAFGGGSVPPVLSNLIANGASGAKYPSWDDDVIGFTPESLAFDTQGRLLVASPATGDILIVRHGAACLAAKAAIAAEEGSGGRLSSRKSTAEGLVATFALDHVAYQCRDRGCTDTTNRGAEWWWYLVVAGGTLLVIAIFAGGVLFLLVRNRNMARRAAAAAAAAEQDDDAEQLKPEPEPEPEGDEEESEDEEGAGVGPLVPRP